MNLRYLQYFTVLARSTSYSQAARKLYISPSALSQAISKLEAEIGVPLVKRDSTGFTLTAAGRTALSRAEEIIYLSEDLKGAVRSGSLDELRLSVVPGANPGRVISLVNDFRNASGLSFRIKLRNETFGQVKKALESGSADVGFVHRGQHTQTWEGVRTIDLGPERVYCIMRRGDGHGAAESDAAEPLRLEDLAGRTVASLSDTQRNFDNQFRSQTGIEFNYYAKTVDLRTAILLAGLGDCVFFSTSDWSRSYEGLSAVPVDFSGNPRVLPFQPHLFLCMRDDREEGSLPALLQAYVEDNPGRW